MDDIRAAAQAHLGSLPQHLRGRYSAELIAKLIDEIDRLRVENAAQKGCTSAARDEIVRLQELRKLDGESLGKSVEEYNRMKELCIDGKYLTDEERVAVEWSIECADAYARVSHRQAKEVSATLRKLLERLT